MLLIVLGRTSDCDFARLSGARVDRKDQSGVRWGLKEAEVGERKRQSSEGKKGKTEFQPSGTPSQLRGRR